MRGEISEIARIWANDKLVNIADYKFRLYHGSQDQMPDPLISAKCGLQKTPAFRGLSYIIFEELPLKDFGDSVPNFSFEVVRKANISINSSNRYIIQSNLRMNEISTEDLVESMIIIPGSGEFVYDTMVQYKTTKISDEYILDKEAINSHNYDNIADSIQSIYQLQITCPNIKWVGPVVCWFADSLDAGTCEIKPCVEFQDKMTEYSEEWIVGKYNRESAKLVSKDPNSNPNYGGTVNDASLIRYLQELKSRDLKIMFYNMFFMDLPGKPWRGHLTGSIGDIVDFFNRENGYNNFILHYAKLVRNHVDAFIIGSELIGLTKVKDANNNFPAVDELIKLAKMVKEIMPQHVLVGYAADWSEYHHTDGGWYNLDKLFASEYIDFVGIDAYFPVTSSISSHISFDEIKQGFEAGEGYDYYLDYLGNKQPLSEAYAWKNLEYWWGNYHYNPDGRKTEWKPHMKKIWFTEFGFPSIDKSTNQPNLFYDPLCKDGGAPKGSSGETDFSIQRKAIKAFIEYWRSKDYVEQMFLWTWDARPYPSWPHGKIWRDSNLWEKGHWVNNKFGACSLGSIILELSDRCSMDLSLIDVTSLDEAVEGLILTKSMNVTDIINSLRVFYFFDIIHEKSHVRFMKRGNSKPYMLDHSSLVKLSDETYLKQTQISKNNIINDLHISFIDRYNEYKNGFCKISDDSMLKNNANIKFPIVLSNIEIANIGKLIIKNAMTENQIIEFSVPANMIMYEPTDFITLNYKNIQYQIRIISLIFAGSIIKITGTIDDIETYRLSFYYKL